MWARMMYTEGINLFLFLSYLIGCAGGYFFAKSKANCLACCWLNASAMSWAAASERSRARYSFREEQVDDLVHKFGFYGPKMHCEGLEIINVLWLKTKKKFEQSQN